MNRKNVSNLWKFYQTYSHNLHFRIKRLEFNNRKILKTHSYNIHSKISGFSSVQFSCSVVSDSLRPHEWHHARPPCPSPTPGVHRNSCPLNRWCHPAILSSVVLFSSCSQSLPASGSFPMSQLLAWGGQSYWSFSFSISPSNEHPGLISFRMDW